MQVYARSDNSLRFFLDTEGEDLTDLTPVELPDGYDPLVHSWNGEAFDVDMSVVKARMFARVKSLRDARETGGLVTPYGPLDTDPDSQRKISGSVVMAMLGGAGFTIEWRMADNTLVSLDATGMSTLGVLVGQHVRQCQTRKNELDAAIGAATTPEELNAIDLEAEWPGS